MIEKPQIIKKLIQNNYSKHGSRLITGLVLHTEGVPPYDRYGGDTRINSTADRSLYLWFNNPTSKVSAHYYVTFSGKIEQYVDDLDVAWHTVGDGNQNIQTISIECQDNGYWEEGRENRYTDAQYAALQRLAAFLSEKYNFPCEYKKAGGVALHRQHDPKPCPGALDYMKIINGANLLLNPNESMTCLRHNLRNKELYEHLKKQRPGVVEHKTDGKLSYTEENIDVWFLNWGYAELLKRMLLSSYSYSIPDDYSPVGMLNYLLDNLQSEVNIWEVAIEDSDVNEDLRDEYVAEIKTNVEEINIILEKYEKKTS
jgi:hypothetical protein